MPRFKDYYAELGVARDASAEEIKRAYRKLARKYHPDVSKAAGAEERFKALGEAYAVLRDPDKRTAYDQLGQHWKAGQEFTPPPGWDAGFEFRRAPAGGFDFSDFFEQIFGDRRAARDGHRARPEARARIAVSLDEAYRGTTRGLTLQEPAFDHSGEVHLRDRTIRVRIPPGARNGQLLRIRTPADAGDVELQLEVEHLPHRLFRATGRDIHLTLPVTPWEAALGASISVPTLGGRVQMQVPAGSQSGQVLRLKGRGLPGDPPGDQYVALRIEAPAADTERSRALYRELARELPFDPRAGM